MKQTKLFCLLLFVFSNTLVISQTSVNYEDLWTAQVDKKILKMGRDYISPTQFRSFNLAISPLQGLLAEAPHEQDIAVKSSSTLLPIPLPDGTYETFRIVEYSMMEPALAAAFPAIKTYRGVSKKNPHHTVRIDMTAHGFRAFLRTEKGSAYIDPHDIKNPTDYLSYWKKDYPQPDDKFSCEIVDIERTATSPIANANGALKSGDCTFRSYRLAVATTAEYSNFHGATSSAQANLVLAAITTTMNRVNGIFENDLAIRLILIANNNSIFYYDSTSDPYTNNSSSALINENQANINSVIGEANYDIGHVFSTGGGGLAALFSPCSSGSKARAVTGSATPIGDPFDIDYVCHEMGHQFGANHTQNNNCNRNTSTAVETGSGSTIMGYAGICAPNVQNSSDTYFHAVSVAEVAAFIVGGNGNNCDTPIASGNNAPTVGAVQDYSIPISTPFVLTAVANDVDGDVMTYCWEQIDTETTFADSAPVATNTDGPAFRSLSPSSSASRYFPNLTDLNNNITPTWEVLPSVSRVMDFRVMVRDNSTSAAGCNIETDTRITTDATTGPFVVNMPTNSGIQWPEGSPQDVTWDVANTTAAPVSCANVDILLSTDGGLTYPTTLISNTPNDGSEQIIVPTGATTTARIMVVCTDNIFFDISNNNFEIVTGTADYNLSFTVSNQSVCPPNNAVFNVNIGSIYGYSDPVNLSVSNLPSGANVSLGSSTISPGNSTTLTITNISGISQGDYTITLNGSSTTGTKTANFNLSVKNIPGAITLSSPTNSEQNISVKPTFSWLSESMANNYEAQLAIDAAFNTIVETRTANNTSWTPTTILDGSTTYYWRVRGTNLCGDAAWVAARSFTTIPCVTYNSTAATPLPLNTANGSNTINIPETGTILDINILDINFTHTWTSDLSVNLTAPNNSTIDLFSALCNDQDDVAISFDTDESNLYASIPCNPLGSNGSYQPSGDLNSLIGQSINGDWILNITDVEPAYDAGTLNSWSVQVCTQNYSALPVQWIDFQAIANEESIYLEWITAQEIDNTGFEIQRKVASETAFKSIAWIDATDTNASRQQYLFEDKNIEKGLAYDYRIRQIDLDGQESYSELRTAMILPKQPIINVFPNPTNSNVNVQIVGQETTATISVYNLQGQIIIPAILFDSQQIINLTELATGLYVVEITTANSVFTQRLVKN